MCVIMIARDVRPTEDMIEKGWKRNDDGGGIAWREKEKNGNVVVRWKKGIRTIEEMYDLMVTVPMPYVAHFRIASSGGKDLQFTHPFPVEPKVSSALSGTTNGYVLFHNGDWKGWSDELLKNAAGFGVRIPRGRFNDTRALAWLTFTVGEGYMEALPSQRGVLFGPEDYEVYVGPGWSKINDVWCSNDYFWELPKPARSMGGGHTSQATALGPWCAYSSCNRKDLVKESKFCPAHHPTPREDGTSGVAQNAPFPQRGRSTVPLVSLELAQKLCPAKGEPGERKISKNMFKRIVDCHERIKSTDIKRSNKAVQDLMTLSHEVFQKLWPGSSFGQPA